MTFFYDLNKKLAALAGVQLNEGKAKPDFLDVDKDGDKKEPMKKAFKDKMKEVEESTGNYSAKKARAGKDIGKPGKQFAKIAKSAAERYGSKERGEKVAGAVLAKLRKEDVTDEGNAFTAKLKATPKGGKFKLGDKEFTDTSTIEEKKEKPKAKNAFDPEVARSMFAPEKGKTKTGHEVKDTGYSKRYTKDFDDTYSSDEDDDNDGAPKKKGRKAVGAGKGKKIGAKHKGTSKLHRKAAIAETDLEEKAVSQAQQKFMGMAHAIQKGEKVKGASSELKKVAKTMKKSDVKDFARTKHKGLPKHVKHEEVEETTTSGSVAPVANAPKTAKSGGIEFGKGVYEAMNEKLESLITEGMNVTVNMGQSQEGQATKNITVSADGDDADALAKLLNLAGLQGQSEHACPTCGEEPCGCAEVVDENAPDWPTEEEYSDDALQYAGGLNKPKATGQTTGAPFNRQRERQGAGQMAEAKDLGMNLYKELQSFKTKK